MRGKDLTGQRFGKLTVIELIPKELRPEKTANRGNHWLCRCDCGNTVIHYTGHLCSNDIQSCGCLQKERVSQSKTKNEIGNKYGNLTVIGKDENSKNNSHTSWICQCECGNIISVKGVSLRSGHTKSCGCVKSWGETIISKYLIEHNIPFKKEFCFLDLKRKNPLRFDFAIFNNNQLSFLIEFQGKQHYDEQSRFYREETVQNDLLKEQYCKTHNIPLYKINYNEKIEEKLEQCLRENGTCGKYTYVF